MMRAVALRPSLAVAYAIALLFYGRGRVSAVDGGVDGAVVWEQLRAVDVYVGRQHGHGRAGGAHRPTRRMAIVMRIASCRPQARLDLGWARVRAQARVPISLFVPLAFLEQGLQLRDHVEILWPPRRALHGDQPPQ